MKSPFGFLVFPLRKKRPRRSSSQYQCSPPFLGSSRPLSQAFSTLFRSFFRFEPDGASSAA